ncbi:MAG: MBL fold metallo-hydrolase [Myxococcales bacterium]|nr:MBL fold metallo-hydrolase [Myxococcales bacterium]
MKYRIAPYWWPLLAATSPALVPYLAIQARKFTAGVKEAEARNAARLEKAAPLELPARQRFELTVIVDHRHADGFIGDAAVVYQLRHERGVMLMDVGFGPERPAFAHNAANLGIDPAAWQALFISHLHPDHMGGLTAVRRKSVLIPPGFAPPQDLPCYLPAPCATPGLTAEVIDAPRALPTGFASTGPLARMLCFTGITEEQAVIARLAGKGLVIVTGCGHPTIEVIIQMVRRLSAEPIHAIIGGLHFPITQSRGAKLGIEFQQIIGTGKGWWERIDDRDLDRTIRSLNESGAERILLSAHDTCDHSLQRIAAEVKAQVEVLTAGVTYTL